MMVKQSKKKPPDVDILAETADARMFVSMATERMWRTRGYRYGRALVSQADWLKMVEAKLDNLAKDCEADRQRFLGMLRRLGNRISELEKAR